LTETSKPGRSVLEEVEDIPTRDGFDREYVFDNGTSDPPVLRQLSRLALELITTTLKPLGEALTQLPAGPGPQLLHARSGPPDPPLRRLAQPQHRQPRLCVLI